MKKENGEKEGRKGEERSVRRKIFHRVKEKEEGKRRRIEENFLCPLPSTHTKEQGGYGNNKRRRRRGRRRRQMRKLKCNKNLSCKRERGGE